MCCARTRVTGRRRFGAVLAASCCAPRSGRAIAPYDPLASDTAQRAAAARRRRTGSAPTSSAATSSAARHRRDPARSRHRRRLGRAGLRCRQRCSGWRPAISAAGSTASSAASSTRSWRFRCSCWRWGSSRRSATASPTSSTPPRSSTCRSTPALARAEANVRRDAGFVEAARLCGNGEAAHRADASSCRTSCRR